VTERRGRTPLTLGHLHIPKTAGTSLNAAVAESLGVREVYFHRVGARKSDEATLRLPRSGPARELVLCYPFFSGHMSIGQLQALNRQRIFSILTDPRIRLVKQFTWVAQAGRIQNCSILEWLKITFAASPEHSSPTLHLIHHGPRPHDRLKRAGLGDRRSSKRWIPNTEDDFRTLTESLVPAGGAQLPRQSRIAPSSGSGPSSKRPTVGSGRQSTPQLSHVASCGGGHGAAQTLHYN
jgi:hypothetical protein